MSDKAGEFDVCIVGSGAAGGIMAKELSEAGAKVVVLEGGRRVDPSEFVSHTWPFELPYRGMRNERQEAFYPGDVRTSIRYDVPEGVSVDRMRVVGGRTVHWNAVSLRFAARDFREWSLAGIEEDWPLSYEEIAPYYERVEQMIGVTGNDDGLEILPGGKHYLPPLRWRCSEHLLNRTLKPMGIPLISVRKAVLTKPYDGRPACHYCGHCMSGCDVSAVFSSATAMLPKAEATGNFTLRQNALAREIQVDKEGLARGVSFVDPTTKKEDQVKAKIVVVCCASVESARLLLNSRSPQHPNGLANSSDVVGRYLHGHMGHGVNIFLDELEGVKPFNQDGATDHVYIPRYNHLAGKTRYSGGWGIQVNFLSYMYPQQANYLEGYGAGFKARVRRMQPGFLFFGIFGKMLASPENRVTVDPNQLDACGIPIPVVRIRFTDNDIALWRDAGRSIAEICSHMKCEMFSAAGAGPGGLGGHEVGTVRMGNNLKTSALNSYCQAHDVKNLFVTDASSFTTLGEKNPTLTIMALSLRAAEYIKEQRRKGEL